jgi:hypothetical protein
MPFAADDIRRVASKPLAARLVDPHTASAGISNGIFAAVSVVADFKQTSPRMKAARMKVVTGRTISRSSVVSR